MPPPRPAVSHKVQTTVTQAPVVYRQERQLIAGRYRLASFHRGDDKTEVWRALDESTTQVVSLEFLRDPDPASKEPFLAGARRLAAVAQPSVMRVAAIHDDSDGTFIVFEHLVHIPVPLEWLKPAIETPVPVLRVAQPTSMETAAAMETPGVQAETAAAATPNVAEAAAGDRGLSLLVYALRSRELSLIDQALLEESAFEFLALALAEFKAVRLDPDLLPDAGAFLVSVLTSGPSRVAGALGRIGGFRPRLRTGAPRVSQPKQPKQPKAPKQPKLASAPPLKATSAKPLKAPKIKEPRAPRAPRGPGLRIRWGRVLTRGLTLGVLVSVLVSLPAGFIGNLGNVATNVATNVGRV